MIELHAPARVALDVASGGRGPTRDLLMQAFRLGGGFEGLIGHAQAGTEPSDRATEWARALDAGLDGLRLEQVAIRVEVADDGRSAPERALTVDVEALSRHLLLSLVAEGRDIDGGAGCVVRWTSTACGRTSSPDTPGMTAWTAAHREWLTGVRSMEIRLTAGPVSALRRLELLRDAG